MWARELNTARLALSGPSPSYQPDDPDAAAVLAALKDTYSGAITLFGSAQLDEDKEAKRERQTLFRPDWTFTVITTATARLYRKILAIEAANPGLWPLAIDRDNLLYPSNDPDPDRACPVPPKPGTPPEQKKTGNQLSQVKNKGSAAMADAAGPLTAGRFAFDKLIPPAGWDPVRGGPARDR